MAKQRKLRLKSNGSDASARVSAPERPGKGSAATGKTPDPGKNLMAKIRPKVPVKQKSDASDSSATPAARRFEQEKETAVRENVPNNENGTDITEERKEKMRLADLMAIEVLPADPIEVAVAKKGIDLMNILGKGGFGVVRRGLWRQKDDMEVAVKILTLEKVENGQKRKGTRLTDVKHEIENMKRLSGHQNIVKLFEYFAVNDDVVIVMQMADAKTLMDLVKKSEGLSEHKTGRWFWELVSAVNWMHAKGVAHRDLKLDNVLLKKPTGGLGHRHCLIVDFGLSRVCFYDETGPRGGIHMFAGHAGTRPYMAPEIVTWSVDRPHAQKYNPMSCDIWALGVCLYCMFTKSYPFDKFESAKQLAKHMDAGPKLKKTIPVDAQDLILAMLEPQPAKRVTTGGILHYKWAVDNNGLKKEDVPVAGTSAKP